MKDRRRTEELQAMTTFFDGFTSGAIPRSEMERLAAIARRVLGGEDLAWDAVQEALVSLWLEREPPRDPRAWLTRTVIHRSLHMARCRSRRRRHEDQARLERTERDDESDPVRHLEAKELRRIWRQALDSIAPEHRTILIALLVDQQSYEAIAARLRIPVGTVRSRLNRARKAMRQVLTRMLPEDYHGFPNESPSTSCDRATKRVRCVVSRWERYD